MVILILMILNFLSFMTFLAESVMVIKYLAIVIRDHCFDFDHHH